MKTVKRKVLGVSCVLLGIFAPSLIYAPILNADSSFASLTVYGNLSVAAAISFLVFRAFRRNKKYQNKAGCLGTLGSIGGILLYYFISSERNSLMYLLFPPYIIIQALYLGPVIFASYIGSFLWVNPEKPEQAGPGYPPQGVGSPDP